MPSPSTRSHPFLQPCINPTPPSPDGSLHDGSVRLKETTYYTPVRSPSEHHVVIYDCGDSPFSPFPTMSGDRPASIVSAAGSLSASVVALSARQRPPSAPPRSVRGATGERIVGGIQRTPLSELGILEGITPAMEVAAAAAPLVAPARKLREEKTGESLHNAYKREQQGRLVSDGRNRGRLDGPPPRPPRPARPLRPIDTHSDYNRSIVTSAAQSGGDFRGRKPSSVMAASTTGTQAPAYALTVTKQSRESHYPAPKLGMARVPKEIFRIPRDRNSNACQFNALLPSKLEGRLSPAAFAFFIQAINVHLRDAHSVSGVITDNVIAVATLWTSACWRASRFEKELRRAEELIGQANKQTFNPKGLHVLSPRGSSLQYLEIECY